MDFKEYKKVKAINASLLKACSFGAYQGYKHLTDTPFESDAMKFGSAVHSALLEPHLFEKEFAFSPKFDKRTKAGKEGHEMFSAENIGKIVLDSEDLDKINLIHQRCMDIEPVKNALDAFEKEKTFIWDAIGLPGLNKFKARLDLVDVQNKVIIDIKTTRDGDAREFVKQMLALRYDIQFNHYARALGGVATCYVVAIESETAQVALYDVTEIVHSGFTDKRYGQALSVAMDVLQMTECPPKFKPEIINLTLPEWALKECI